MKDFLLELRSEEIPARMQAGARVELEKLFRRELTSAGIDVGDVTVWSTPRRLALIAKGLPDATEAVSEEAKGPPEGAPEAALEGFCRKNGVTADQLQLRDVKGRQTWFAVIERPGRTTKAVLAGAIPAIVRDFAWPKSMRWGAASLSTESPRWVRPLSGIVAILGDELVECEAADVRSGYATLGHRFHHAGEITIGGAHDYAEKLHACHVIVDHEERAALIREGATKAAADAGLTLVEDEGLVIENAGLTEWPVPLLSRFNEAFLDVPPEVIQLTARVNQKYFVCATSPLPLARGAGGGSENALSPEDRPTPDPSRKREGDALANAFICTANIAAADGGAAIVEGNRKVLAARLSDARFFWEQDRKTTLESHAKKLERITFHEKLGTVADKVERVAKLARWLVEQGIVGNPPRNGEGDHAKHGGGAPAASAIPQGSTTPTVPLHHPAGGPPPPVGEDRAHLANLAEQAARLAKADLVTEMVGEFPELQGVMGGYYARAEGLPDAVADAIRDHYKPVGQGDEVPTAPVTVAVSLADKFDTLANFLTEGLAPTGSKDPFALRRAAVGIIRLIESNSLRLDLVMTSFCAVAERVTAETFKESNKAFQRFSSSISGVFEVDVALDILEQGVTSSHEKNKNFKKEPFLKSLSGVTATRDFVVERIAQAQKSEGIRDDLIAAVRQWTTGAGTGAEFDVVRLLARVHALQRFVGTEDGANLLAAYKRAANILKKEDWHGREGEIAQTGEEDPLALVDDPDMKAVIDARMAQKRDSQTSYSPEPAEADLAAALDAAEPTASAAVEAEDFAAAMRALASLRAPIDRFFTEVMINDPDRDKRAARLDLLLRFRDAVHRVADFSKIEG